MTRVTDYDPISAVTGSQSTTYDARAAARQGKIFRLHFFFICAPQPNGQQLTPPGITSSTIKQKVHISFHKFLTHKDLQNVTPFPDYSARKHLLIQQLCRSLQSETGQKVIRIRKSFDAANSLPLRRLWHKNFPRSPVSRHGFPNPRLSQRQMSH